MAGAKDDALDAYVLADSLRTDRALYRKVSIDAKLIIELREMSRMWDDLVEERVRLANRLREQIYRYSRRCSRCARPPMSPGSGR